MASASKETKEEGENEDEEGVEPAPQAQQQGLRRTGRQRKAQDGLNLHTLSEETYGRTEYALITGNEIGNIGTGRPGEVGYMPADPPTYDDAVSGPDAEGWIASMRDERQSLLDRDVFEWVDPPDDAQLLPSRFLNKWKYNQDGVAFRQKSRVVVQGYHEADAGADKAAPVASQESVHLLASHAAKHGLLLRQADVRTAFLYARVPPTAKAVYVIPPNVFECASEQSK